MRWLFFLLVPSVAQMTDGDVGVYRCEADNGVGKDIDQVSISFTCSAPTEPTITGDRPNKLYELGSGLLLKCYSEGKPTPNVQWFRGGRMVSRQPELVINSISRADAGIYSCRASNLCGRLVTKEKDVEIIIRDAPPSKPNVRVKS